MNNAAKTLVGQIGNGAFAMMGARDLVDTGNGLMFGFRGSKKCNKLVIELHGDDTYRLQFWSIRGMKTKLVADLCGVMIGELRRTIEAETGLYLSL